MNIFFKNWIAASLIVFGAVQVNAASITGTIQLTRDSSRSVNGVYLVTEKKDASGKPIALVVVLDENGRAIAQQYENKQIRIDGNVSGRNLTAIEWKEIKDNSYSNSSYSDSSSSRSSSYDEEETEESEEEIDEESEEEEEEGSKKKSSKSSKKSKKNSDDEEEEYEDTEESSDEESIEDESENSDSEDSDESEDSDNSDSEESEDEESSDEEEEYYFAFTSYNCSYRSWQTFNGF